MASELLLATRSADKAKEIRAILAGATSATLVTLSDLAIEPDAAEDAIENHPTFIDNALAKAEYFARLTGRRTLADDSGLMVRALEGRPGVRTKRFAADHGFTGDNVDRANNNLLLERLEPVHDSMRQAQYVCAAALADPHGATFAAIATCQGKITRAPRGSGGFGYDPLFFLADLDVTFAELTSAQKNARSHRARAFRALAAHLK